MTRNACRCCGFWTLDEPATGSFKICRVCDWEDDPVQNEDRSYEGGANARSLRQLWQILLEASSRNPMLLEVSGWLDNARSDFAEPCRQILLAEMARSIVGGYIELLDGCLALARIAGPVHPDGPSESIKAVASEVDELPRGSVRMHWSPDALATKDA